MKDENLCWFTFKQDPCPYSGNGESCDKTVSTCNFYGCSMSYPARPKIEKITPLSRFKRLLLNRQRRKLESKPLFTRRNILLVLLSIISIMTIYVTFYIYYQYDDLKLEIKQISTKFNLTKEEN